MHHSGTGSHHMPTTSPAPASTPTRTTHQLSRSIHTTPWPRRARQAGKQKPAILAAAKTTGDGTSTDTTVKKKRVQRKTAADGDVAPPKARKAARPIKRTNADEMFLQLLPEDGIEQLQHQLKDEMHALVERKGGKMMASGTSKKSVEVGAANAPPDVASDEPPTTSGQATGVLGADSAQGDDYPADATPRWYALKVSENYGKRVAVWVEDTVRLKMSTATLQNGQQVERPIKTWIPEKTIKAYNHSTRKMGNKRLQFQQGGVLLLKTIMDRDMATALESSTFTHGWVNQDMQSISNADTAAGSTTTKGRRARKAASPQVITLPKPCTDRYMESVDKWLQSQEDETEEEALEDRYGGLPGPISGPSTRIEDQQGLVEVYTVEDSVGNKTRKVVKYKSDAYRGTFTNPNRWYDPTQQDQQGLDSAEDDFTLSLVDSEPPRRRNKRDQQRKQYIKDDFYHAPQQGRVGSGYDAGPMSTSQPAQKEADVDDLLADSWGEDTSWKHAWEDTEEAAESSNVGQSSSDDVDALLTELQYEEGTTFDDKSHGAATSKASVAMQGSDDWDWFLAELDSSKEGNKPPAQPPTASQDDWLDALFDTQPDARVEGNNDHHYSATRVDDQHQITTNKRGPSTSNMDGLVNGTAVEVMEGPWRGFTGSVVGEAGRQRVALQLDVFGKLTEAEVDVAHCREYK